MPNDDQDRIRARAHEIWEAEGQPAGRADDHWAQAEREVMAQEGDAELPNPLATGAAADMLAKPKRRRKATEG